MIHRHAVYLVTATLSLVGHVALIGYSRGIVGGTPFPPDSGRSQALTAFLQPEKRPQRHVEVVHSFSRDSRIDGDSKSIHVSDAEPETLFPRFYSVRYYDPKELSRKPFVTTDIPRDFALRVPDVPEDAAILLLLINEYGDIDKVVVEDSSLPQTAQAELETVLSEMKFFPGQIKGVPVKSRLKIQIRLAPEKHEAQNGN